MQKKAFFFIDDVIWIFRDLTRRKPVSMFDHPFLKTLKTAHQSYGLKVQLNIFYRTDFFYGNDEFTLADMTDAYRAEWESASDWLKLGFHAKQEFPAYPYVNASYEDVKANFESIHKEVLRFAGPASFAYATVMHWTPVSKEGCKAFRDCGIRLMDASIGETSSFEETGHLLPYGHDARLLHNRQPETRICTRKSNDEALAVALSGYNHLPESAMATRDTLEIFWDAEIGMHFKNLEFGACLNLTNKEDLPAEYEPMLQSEYLGYMTHEQYFFSDYYAYQPDMEEKIFYVAELLKENGYEHFFPEELVPK